MDINTSLLRERFVIQEQNMEQSDNAMHRIALSNRMILKLQAGSLPAEIFIVRTKMMHSCARLCAELSDNYERHGPLMPRKKTIDWSDIWDNIQGDYDRRYHKDGWISIYHKGKPVFSKGNYHKFFDVIEHCDFMGNGDYHKSIPIAEKAFAQVGKDIDIEYDSNVAMVSIGNRSGGRCSMLTRGADHSSTFNMNISANSGDKMHISQLFSSSGDFLEAVQLCYIIGEISEHIDAEIIEKFSDEARQAQRAGEELRALDAKIDSLEQRHRVRYRPERPNFDLLVEESKRETREKLKITDEGDYIE